MVRFKSPEIFSINIFIFKTCRNRNLAFEIRPVSDHQTDSNYWNKFPIVIPPN